MYKHIDRPTEVLMGFIRRIETYLSPEDDWIEDDRRVLFEALEKYLGKYHTFISEKTFKDYTLTTEQSSDKVEEALYKNGYQRNLASKRAYRTDHSGGRQWSDGSWVNDPPSVDWQYHITLFESKSGGSDVYAHRETSIREEAEHLTEPKFCNAWTR